MQMVADRLWKAGLSEDEIKFLMGCDLMLLKHSVPLFIAAKEDFGELDCVDRTHRFNKMSEDMGKKIVALSNLVTVNEKVFKDGPRRVLCVVTTIQFVESTKRFKTDEGVVFANKDIACLIYLV